MDSAHVVQFLLSLGVDDDDIIVDEERQWVRASCPFAPWTHASGKDSNPSFGISIRENEDDGISVANCLTCGNYQGDKQFWTIPELIHRYRMVTNIYPKAAAQIYISGFKDDGESYIMKKEKEDRYIEPVKPLPKSLLDQYPLVEERQVFEVVGHDVIDYLQHFRGIPYDLQKFYGVRFNPDNNTMVFPLTGMDCEIYTLRERVCSMLVKKMWTVNAKTAKRTDVVFPKITESGAMFGMAQFDRNIPEAWLCEGEIDAMALKNFGATNPLGAATNQITKAQAQAFIPYIDTLYHVPDAELSGVISVQKVLKFFGDTDIIIRVLDCGLITVDDRLSYRKRKAKDAGDLEKREQLDYLKEHAITTEEFIKKYENTGKRKLDKSNK